MAVVPGHELGRGPRAREVLAGNAEAPVRLRPDRVDHGVVYPREVLSRDVAPHLDVPEEAKARPLGDLLERARDSLDVLVVRRDAEPDEPPGRGKPLDHVHLGRSVGGQQSAGGVEPGRP